MGRPRPVGWLAKLMLQVKGKGIRSQTMDTNKLQETKVEKAEYRTPTLTVYGNVEEITQASPAWGTGDWILAQMELPDVLAS